MFNPIAVKRAQLCHQLFSARGPKCEKCYSTHSNSVLDLHEGIVSKGDVRGWPKKKRGLINHKYNCFIVCRSCHNFNRQWFWDKSCERYGEEKVREWYEGLPWKAGVPRRFWDAD